MALTQKQMAKVFWFLDFFGAVKINWVRYLQRYFSALGAQMCILDGDILGQGINKFFRCSLADREAKIRRACKVAGYLIKQNIIVVIPLKNNTLTLNSEHHSIPHNQVYSVE